MSLLVKCCSFNALQLIESSSSTIVQARGNAWRASIGKISRAQFLKKYPVQLIRPDGSSITIRADEPRQIVQLAVDLKSLSEDEIRQRLAARKPKVKKMQQEVIDDNFDANEYMHFWSSSSQSASPQAQPASAPAQTVQTTAKAKAASTSSPAKPKKSKKTA